MLNSWLNSNWMKKKTFFFSPFTTIHIKTKQNKKQKPMPVYWRHIKGIFVGADIKHLGGSGITELEFLDL